MKTPATVITGFLGAGKTTLIRHLLNNANGRRLAIVVNEFGDLGMDRDILLGCGDVTCTADDVIELANGCICCTVADAFLPTMETILASPRRPDHIVIETSGLALPKPLVQAFQWPDIRSRVTVDGVIAVIDGPAVAEGRFADDPQKVAAERAADPALSHDEPLRELFEDQITCADLVIVNKTDGLDAGAAARVDAIVRARARPATKVVSSRFGVLDPRVVLGLGIAAEDDVAGRPSHHDNEGPDDHDHDEFVSFVARIGPVADPGDLERRIAGVVTAHDVLRIKGVVDVPGKAMRCVVQAVGARVERYFDRPWRPDEERTSALVVIGDHEMDTDAVTAALVG
jgi:cobalamin biosynthesis protein CobW